MENNIHERKIPVKVKLGYGLGTVGDSIPYSLFFTYFIFYLTDYVGMSPSLAGVISFVSVVWLGVLGPIVGYISDNSSNPKGRRRPIMMKAAIPYAIVIALTFLPINASGMGGFVYYLIMAMLFNSGYALWKGPWDALGPELTQDYTERNNIRFWVSLCAYPATMVVSSGVIFVVGIFGNNPNLGWFIGALMCAVIVLIGSLACVGTTKGYEIFEEREEATKLNLMDLIKQYISILKVKAYRNLTIMQFIFVIGYIILCDGTVYCLTYNAGLSETQQSIFWIVHTLLCIGTLPIATAFANKFDKKRCVIVFLGLAALSYVVFYVYGINGFTSAMIFSICVAFATTVFYGVLYSLIYDCTEVCELATGKRTEGAIMAMSQLAQTLGSAVAGLLYGLLLTSIGYDPANVTEATVHGILLIVTLIPAIFSVVALLMLIGYRVNPANFEQVKQAIEERKAGKEINLKEFKDII